MRTEEQQGGEQGEDQGAQGVASWDKREGWCMDRRVECKERGEQRCS